MSCAPACGPSTGRFWQGPRSSRLTAWTCRGGEISCRTTGGRLSSVSFSPVHGRSGEPLSRPRVDSRPPMNAGERPCTPPTNPPPQLESVLGATPHEFESRILRQCLTGHDVEGPPGNRGPFDVASRRPAGPGRRRRGARCVAPCSSSRAPAPASAPGGGRPSGRAGPALLRPGEVPGANRCTLRVGHPVDDFCGYGADWCVPFQRRRAGGRARGASTRLSKRPRR